MVIVQMNEIHSKMGGGLGGSQFPFFLGDLQKTHWQITRRTYF